MYIHGELERHGFKLTEIFAFGNPVNCRVKYEFKNDKVHAIINRYFDGKVNLYYSQDGAPLVEEYTTDRVVDEIDLIHHVRDFLKEHA